MLAKESFVGICLCPPSFRATFKRDWKETGAGGGGGGGRNGGFPSWPEQRQGAGPGYLGNRTP